MPMFTPEHFRVARPADRTRVKQFRAGLEQLDEEGVIQMLRHPDLGDQAPLLAAVGVLQFDVAAFRMEHEFRSPVRLEGTRLLRGPPHRRGVRRAAAERMRDVTIYDRSSGTPMALFRDKWQLQRIERDNPELVLDRIVTA